MAYLHFSFCGVFVEEVTFQGRDIQLYSFEFLNVDCFVHFRHYPVIMLVHLLVCFFMYIFLGSQHRFAHHRSAPNTPTGEYGDISALEKEKVTQ